MANRLQVIARAARRFVSRVFRPSLAVQETVVSGETAEPPFSAERMYAQLARAQRAVLWIAPVAFAAWLLYAHWPVQSVARGEVGVRTNQLTGTITQWREGSVLVFPGLHDTRVYSLRDQVYRAAQMSSASGPAPLQSIEGLSVGVDLAVRYALDGTRIATVSKNLPDNYGAEIVEPAVQGVIYKVFARYTVREIFSSKRAEIQQTIESELKSRLAADGIVLRGVQMGKVDLPADYKRGMEGLLAEELESQKMQYTLELKEKQVRQGELEANAEKVRREVRAEAAAREQVIAAKAQEEAMKHVIPFKQQQIEQRKLEAEADKQSRVKAAEGTAQARRIEASGEADARLKLAEAEAWRLERIGKVSTDQMAREGALVTQHPLLIQKAMADKLSDKIQVIIAPPPTDGSFVGGTLLGGSGKSGAVAQR
jgi:regulator of protease activity HflC (stomatin/prohibitin superfamily)